MSVLFIGGGNMASAIIGGLIKSGADPRVITVVEPSTEQRLKLQNDFRVGAVPAVTEATRFDVAVWAVKPQSFAAAAAEHAQAAQGALQLSVMAGVRAQSIARHTAMPYVVRCMPNTPALIGMGITGLFATAACSAEHKRAAEAVLKPTGELLWVDREEDLDAVTALSGSGPAYVFYFVEAMMRAAQDFGMSAEQGKQLALATFTGAAELARRSPDSAAVLRERVTSKGGTTAAALKVFDEQHVHKAIVCALHMARKRAKELGDELESPQAG
jgi:pyrroline-5-carboxylate reductase